MKKTTTYLFLYILFFSFNQSGNAQKRSEKRGVSYDIPYVGDLPILSQGISWFYNWGTSANSAIESSYNKYMEYCPMAWNGTNAAALRTFKAAHPECKYILAFNEPNLTDQANMTPAQAAAKWPALKAIAAELNLKIISPAMNFGTLTNYSDPNKWLDEFFTLVPLSDVDGIAVHTYMNWQGAVSWYVGLFAKYNKPIWMTEFCAWEYSAPLTTNATVGYAFQRDEMVEKVEFLELNPKIVKYAWFIPRTSNDGEFPYMQLLKKVQGTVPAGTLTELGQIYVNMSTFDSTKYYGVNEKIAAKDYMKSAPVKLEASTDLASAYPIQICNFEKNVFAEYFINVPSAGVYPLTLRMTNTSGINPVFKVTSNNIKVTSTDSVSLTSTGGTNNWDSRSISLTLPAGKQTLRITSSGLVTGVKLQWLSLSNTTDLNPIRETQLKVFVDNNQILQVFCNQKIQYNAVIDLSAKMLLSNTTSHEINVSSLENGVYILQTKLENGNTISSKFFINK